LTFFKVVVSVILPHDQLEHAIKLLKHHMQSAYGRKPLDALTPEEVLSLFENSHTAEELLPKGLLIQGWLPLSTHKSNLELLIQRGVVWFHSEHCEETSDCESNTKSRDTSGTIFPSSGFLSLGTPPYSVPLGDGMYRFDIDLFGTDPISAKTHVLQQLIKGVQLLPPGLTPVPQWKEQIVLEQNLKRH
ncbi:histidine N-acetyltransferase-like, partial [Xenopus laevis]|uniref:Histidine N-acetyltransferase-like n=1 Tax=Xenopus laevis TaxID=8355 RepID=A0A8J1MPB9_XENLA